jgi:hypothetical protein
MAKYLCIALYFQDHSRICGKVPILLKVYLDNCRSHDKVPVYSSIIAKTILVFVAKYLCIAESVPTRPS